MGTTAVYLRVSTLDQVKDIQSQERLYTKNNGRRFTLMDTDRARRNNES